jgi:subtilisin family serine protease
MKYSTIAMLFVLVAIIMLAWAPREPFATAGQRSPIDPALAQILNSQDANQPISVIITLNNPVDLQSIPGTTRAERLKHVIMNLQRRATSSQARLLKLLLQRSAEGSVQSFKPLWIINGIALTAKASVINEIATYAEVAQIAIDEAIPAPPATTLPPSQPANRSTIGPEVDPLPQPNISLIHAPDLWNMGFRGQGIVIASMDTGVEATHPDLSAQYRGGSNSWYDAYGQYATPYDSSGHGTQTMGIMVGGTNDGTAIGVAPNATWIAAKIFRDNGTGTTSNIHSAFQWLLNPDGNINTDDAPNIVNNSWESGTPGCTTTFAADLAALVAAGITPVFSAGNFGPSAPSDHGPANNPNAFSVGATNNSDVIASISSRGPNSCAGATPATYPAVVAPGVSVYTSDKFGLYTTASGTSFSAPHVSGALALLLSAFPSLTVAQQEAALITSVIDLGATGADNTYGSGRIDVLAAYNELVNNPPPTPTATPTATNTPTATSTSTPTATNTPTATPTATSTPTSQPATRNWGVYLPFVTH